MSNDLLEESLAPEGLVPYAPDFTPATLGKTLGNDNVLEWLLKEVAALPYKAQLSESIARHCLKHVSEERDRRDMASHVIQGLQNYLLATVRDDNRVALTSHGAEVLAATATTRDVVFAQHILTRCNGYRLIEAIQRHEVRGDPVTLEALTRDLDRSATSKNISTMKAWLARAGVMKPRRGYTVDEARLADVIGEGAPRLLGLEPPQIEFLLAARVLAVQRPNEPLEAPEIRLLAELRAPDVRIPSKALATFVRRLVDAQLLEEVDKVRSRGGTRVAVRFTASGLALTDDQVRGFVAQATTGMPLARLLPLAEVFARLKSGNSAQMGLYGEMLAVHACLMLNVRVVGWRVRAPIELDLTGERIVGLAYQRWHVQVKNTQGDLDADRVDREIGAAAGTGATHILFIVPRAGITTAARAEIQSKNRLTHLHVFALTSEGFNDSDIATGLARELRAQEAQLVRVKRLECERREQRP